MKKQFLLSLIAAFVMALSANAQGNTYNMKVKMADGTEITIGPNDIENISFNEGAVVVSGIKLQELLEKLASVRLWEIGDDGYWYVDGVKTDHNSRGEKGDKGDTGMTGADGMVGAMGPMGPKGEKGDKGDKGDTGMNGADGMVGAMGPMGPKGEKGDPGSPGMTGADGKPGTSWEIGDDGYWYRDGMKTAHKAVRDAEIEELQRQIDELKAKL
jgi:hypothetical protein